MISIIRTNECTEISKIKIDCEKKKGRERENIRVYMFNLNQKFTSNLFQLKFKLKKKIHL